MTPPPASPPDQPPGLSPALPQVPRRSLVESAIDLIRSQVESGVWKVGERIPKEAELAEMLQVGRNTVREAVRVLSHARMLEVRQGDGTYVRSSVDPAEIMRRVSRASLRDHFELRVVLETEAARLAATRATAEDLLRLQQTLDARNAISKDDDFDAFVTSDIAFHVAVARAAHNSALEELYRYFSTAVLLNVRSSLIEHNLPEPDAADHAAIVTAIVQRDPDRAADAARAVLAPAIAALTRMIED
ncbi:FadR family transcriptional regulator [Bradyrhizobium sp. U87765 SZCCT0131]|uniref:FadR/GntR family transcriptional regulator n=1 Tax=unclassified Bradyrhizobium TaxID=2631580 RepID=UPI001BA73BDF|nr:MULTISPECIES: FCD domain-containing protein [unclassified Bradyrhizobium]MBR1219517.1 FadR family transcriptional regulator [Bradyrhizobium sp. U87765 SZCCT0131]MBR1262168.1 FadR family transcriptional regulator [Bradyrhizobium sp. U87765 SZCCT0134]MBR1308649.1 FadR family transcriptional regulator [Bradyrhizobium sp. U87765 SZCCT0110]MBR1317950.1 FadR family transcriptional regulator [Bradyrhizobium sp. U87765 SZCCT0109]MBR1351653.1 FadR family transcriptional regulator [Bradyrhizobium sp.